MKKFLIFCFTAFFAITLSAQIMQTHIYAERDTQQLALDIYFPENPLPQKRCIVYIFGGGFMSGARTEPKVTKYAQQMSERGYVVAAIDYRLGLKGVKSVGISSVKTLRNAIDMAVEDCASAVAFLLAHADEFGIDSTQIILVGSSAGAITALQTDYAFANGFDVTSVLPDDFRFAGIVAYSGAILSFDGKLKYPKHNPAPTLLVHGTHDKIVNYNQIRFCNIGFFGTKEISKQFLRSKFPYFARHYTDLGHEVAAFYFNTTDLFDQFVENFIVQKRELCVDENFIDLAKPPSILSNAIRSDLYNPAKREKFIKEFEEYRVQKIKVTNK